MKAGDTLVLKDKEFDRRYKQIQFDFEGKKITDVEYIRELKNLHIQLLVHLEDIKNYRDLDPRLLKIKTIEDRLENIKEKINYIYSKFWTQTEKQKTQEKLDRDFAEKLDRERVEEIFVIGNDNTRQVGVKLTSGTSEYVDLNNQSAPLNYPDKALSILENIVRENKLKLKEWANLYKENKRDFYFFIYDLTALAFYLEQLPRRFNMLQSIKGSYENLMHNRIMAQLAVEYKKQRNTVNCEVQNDRNKKPDLQINDRYLEVKTIVSAGINHPDHFVRFSKSIRNRFDEACKQIDVKNDVIVVVPWSQIMSNILKTYYYSMFNNVLPAFSGGTTILVFEGEKPFEDFYLEFPSKIVCEDIREFSESGYKRISPMSYLGSFRRKGFAITRSSDSSLGWGISIDIT